MNNQSPNREPSFLNTPASFPPPYPNTTISSKRPLWLTLLMVVATISILALLVAGAFFIGSTRSENPASHISASRVRTFEEVWDDATPKERRGLCEDTRNFSSIKEQAKSYVYELDVDESLAYDFVTWLRYTQC